MCCSALAGKSQGTGRSTIQAVHGVHACSAHTKDSAVVVVEADTAHLLPFRPNIVTTIT